MILINIASTSGGTGRTSVACALANQLKALGRPVVLLQADPSNNLGVTLGMTETHAVGLAQKMIHSQDLAECMYTTPQGLQVLPFGKSTHVEQLVLNRLLMEQPHRLRELFQDASIDDASIVVVDLPRWPSAWCKAFFDLGDLNLLTLVPDLHSMHGIDALLPELLTARGASYFLMNRFDSTKVLHLDVWTMSKVKLSHRLLPFYLHEDQSLPESQAAGVELTQYAPSAQLTEDLNKLALWIDGEIQ